MRMPVVILICISALMGCGSQSETSDSAIPDDVWYSIVSDDALAVVKRSVDVRISRAVSEAAIREIATDIKSKDSVEYERTFISYYLPGMEVGSGAWATSHYNPEVEVRILGLPEVSVSDPVPQADGSKRDVIGQWTDNRPGMGSVIEIHFDDGSPIMTTTYADDSVGVVELVEVQSGTGRRFNPAEESSFGDHWIIDSPGRLQIRDSEGLIESLPPIE